MSFHVQRNIRSGKEVFLFSYLSIPFLLRMPISVIKSSLSPPSKCLVYPPLPLYLLCYCPSQAFVFSFAKNFILFITGVLAFVPCPLLVPSPYPSILTRKSIFQITGVIIFCTRLMMSLPCSGSISRFPLPKRYFLNSPVWYTRSFMI